jgi:hypothetical protein
VAVDELSIHLVLVTQLRTPRAMPLKFHRNLWIVVVLKGEKKKEGCEKVKRVRVNEHWTRMER